MNTLNRRKALQYLGAGLVGAMVSGKSLGAGAASERPPNTVLVFADDLGYGDLSCYGAPQISTPNLDRMAEEGLRFTDFYSCASICSPARAGLLTGRYPIRLGINRVFFPQSADGLDSTEITVASLLKKQGYATACIGKWHLGHLPQYLPTRHGFDYYFGLPYSNDMSVEERGDPPLPLMRNEEIVEQPARQDTLTRRYTEEAIQFIDHHQDEPFFVYLPHSMPHVPLHRSESFVGKSKGGLYGDVIEELDWSVGEILKALQDRGLDENTLVIFTSDNGPWLSQESAGGSAAPLREGKGSAFEGGFRVPCIMRWRGHIEAGRVERSFSSTLDFLPTFVALAGGAVPDDRPLDGENIGPILLEGKDRDQEEFHYFVLEEYHALRLGQWKLKRPFNGKIYGKPVAHPTLLFDLNADPEEQHNLAGSEKERVRAMEAHMDKFWASLQPLVKAKR
ncbi:MAG: sulfatase [Candidatus Hydrogenedentales bacterium]|jgi:arylsulfatase A